MPRFEFQTAGKFGQFFQQTIHGTFVSQYVDSQNRQQDTPEIILAAAVFFFFNISLKIECVNK